jgi:probable F420-dependent oxidoreductase
MHPFRFGLLIERFPEPAYVLEVARRAEASGFSTFLIRDHLIDEPFGPQYAPWTTLAGVAQATTTLRVGTLVIDNDFRHPTLLAKEVTTLDQLSGGRVELGLGAGFLREEYRRAGLPFDANSVRVDRLAEALPVLDGLLRGKPVTFHGQHYQLDGFTNFPPPRQTPRPPMLVGGAGPRMLALAARCADAVALLPSSLHRGELTDSVEARSLDNVRRQVASVRQAAGERFAELQLCLMATVLDTDDRYAAAEQLAAQRGWQVPAETVLAMPSMLIGDVEVMAEHLERLRADTGVTYLVVRDSQLDAAISVVRRQANR